LTRLVAEALRERVAAVELPEGDQVRTHLSKGLGYTKEDRDTNVLPIAYLAGSLGHRGGVVSAVISPSTVVREQARAMTRDFVEIFVDVPLEKCLPRQVKAVCGPPCPA
jgi:adenylylsulfate kinase